MNTRRWLPGLLIVVSLLGSPFAACRAGAPGGFQPAPGPQTVVLISLDGFRADYLDRPAAAGLRALAGQGVRALGMEPVFPTKTFPNHYTIVTGLYPEHHGIVANTMEDPTLGRFVTSDTLAVRNGAWWGGEPIWTTAERQGVRSAALFWPGSEAPNHGIRPSFYAPYDDDFPHEGRIRQVLDWLRLPSGQAPRLVTMYFSVVDGAGHNDGPDSPQVDSAIARVDSAVTALAAGIEALGIAGRVNVVVVSDHGMTSVDAARQIFLDDYVPVDAIRVVDWTPVGAVVPRAGAEAEVYRRLVGAHPHLQVYRREGVPERFHYRAHPRITPLVLVADDGWTITTHARAESAPPRGGNHGFDNRLSAMQALFVAWGPAFRSGIELPRVRNLDVYDLLAAVLGISPAPNDGDLDSIRVVLRGR